MADYSKMSDFEINKLVASSLGGFESEDIFELQGVIFKRHGKYQYSVFDPCNDPSEAWPIILSNLIALKPVKLYVGGHRWFASKGDGDFGLKFADDNPLRAAMIVYLMMKESENG
ncbi:DUF2591 family protein [Hafnia alvei]|uniref:phage protein NinX family protein n=1 Tax=Hafnia alvei TaxID=569 RepID=UPI000B69323F|nr:phage protein NinX family protein [Hafnia alvei]MBI0276863.1 DUF2591 family protein [Hafnia alvei]PNK99903.1 recombinase [Hafnia alvei]